MRRTLVPSLFAAFALAAACAPTIAFASPSPTNADANDDATRDYAPPVIDAPPPPVVLAEPVQYIGLINNDLGGDPNAPTSPWDRDDLWASTASARPGMFDESIHDRTGSGGLQLSGVGAGGSTFSK